MFTDWEPLLHTPLAMRFDCLLVVFDVLAQDWVKQWRYVFDVFLLDLVDESYDFVREVAFVHAFEDLVHIVDLRDSVFNIFELERKEGVIIRESHQQERLAEGHHSL